MAIEAEKRLQRDRLLTLAEVAEMTRQSEGTIRWLRYEGRMPRPGKIGRRLFWKESQIAAWIEDKFEAQGPA